MLKCWGYMHYSSGFGDNEHTICQIVPRSYYKEEPDMEESSFVCMQVICSTHPDGEFTEVGAVYCYVKEFLRSGGNYFHKWEPIRKDEVPFLLLKLLDNEE